MAIYAGLKIEDKHLVPGMWIFFGCFTGFEVVLEVYYQLSSRRKVTFIPNPNIKKNANHNKVAEMMNAGATVSQINEALPYFKWCIFDDYLIDLDSIRHPGGQHIINSVKGREIGRYVYGIYGLETAGDNSKHKHSASTIPMLASKAFGRIRISNSLFLPVDHSNSALLKQRKEVIVDFFDVLGSLNYDISKHQPYDWRIEEKVKLSNSIVKFNFQNERFLIYTKYTGVEDFGRHIKISHKYHPATRYYSIVICLSDENINYRNELIQYYNKIMVEKEKDIPVLFQAQASTTLPVVAKRYSDQQSFSKFIHDNPIGGNFSVIGPCGMGLELTKYAKGQHLIFACGTGILPFLDLFDFMLRKVIDEILTETEGKEVADKINIFQQNYSETFDPSFRITLYAAFPATDDFLGLEIVQKLCQLCKIHNKPYFEAFIKISQKGTNLEDVIMLNSRFTKEVVQSAVREDLEKVYICGTPQFNKELSDLLSQIEVRTDKILFV